MCKIEKIGFSCKIDKKFAQTDAVSLTVSIIWQNLSSTQSFCWEVSRQKI